jgi:hypothetical protein
VNDKIERLKLAAEDAAGGLPSAEQVDALIAYADALEAELAARQPSEDDREATEAEIDKAARALHMAKCCSLSGDSPHDFPEASELFAAGVVLNAVPRAAAPDAATEIAQLRAERDAGKQAEVDRAYLYQLGLKLGAERDAAIKIIESRTCGENVELAYRRAIEAQRERDAALAAVERVRGLIAEWKHEGPSGPFPDRIAIDVGVEVIEPLLAALDGAPEPETPELFPGTNAALDRLTVRKAAPANAFCVEHGNFHAVELGDPTCEFEDGFGEPVEGEKP